MAASLWDRPAVDPRSHVPDMPFFVAILRVVQMLTSIIVLGLSAWAVSAFFTPYDLWFLCVLDPFLVYTHRSGSSSDSPATSTKVVATPATSSVLPTNVNRYPAFVFFAFAWTILYMIWLGVAVGLAPIAYNIWAHLALECLTTLFWLTAMALLASNASVYSSVAAYLPIEDLNSNQRAIYNAFVYGTDAAAGIAALVFLLFVATLIHLSLSTHKHINDPQRHILPRRSGVSANPSAVPGGAAVQGQPGYGMQPYPPPVSRPLQGPIPDARQIPGQPSYQTPPGAPLVQGSQYQIPQYPGHQVQDPHQALRPQYPTFQPQNPAPYPDSQGHPGQPYQGQSYQNQGQQYQGQGQPPYQHGQFPNEGQPINQGVQSSASAFGYPPASLPVPQNVATNPATGPWRQSSPSPLLDHTDFATPSTQAPGLPGVSQPQMHSPATTLASTAAAGWQDHNTAAQSGQFASSHSREATISHGRSEPAGAQVSPVPTPSMSALADVHELSVHRQDGMPPELMNHQGPYSA